MVGIEQKSSHRECAQNQNWGEDDNKYQNKHESTLLNNSRIYGECTFM